MICCLRTRVRKHPIMALYFEFEIVLQFYNLEARIEHNYCTIELEVTHSCFTLNFAKNLLQTEILQGDTHPN